MSPDKKQLPTEEQRESPAASAAPMEPEVSARFLTIVRDLVWELHPHLRRSTPVGLDSDFDRDLALDSLGRAELILRLDKAFKVRLPDHLLSEADTPQELLTAVLAARPDRRAMLESAVVAAVVLPEIAAPSRPRPSLRSSSITSRRMANGRTYASGMGRVLKPA